MPLQIKTDILINAQPDAVWQALTDFSAYPQWNPFIKKIERLSEKELIAEMGEGLSKTTFRPIIITMNAPHEFRWLGKLGGLGWLFKGEHYFILSLEQKGTNFIHGENFSGILAWLLWPMIKKDIRNNFIRMNQALKALVEKA